LLFAFCFCLLVREIQRTEKKEGGAEKSTDTR
jgi:hypothetical protein